MDDSSSEEVFNIRLGEQARTLADKARNERGSRRRTARHPIITYSGLGSNKKKPIPQTHFAVQIQMFFHRE